MRRLPTLILVTLLALAVAPEAVPAAARVLPVEPGLLQATEPRTVLARFDRRVPADIAGIPGVSLLYRFGAIPAVALTAEPRAIRALAERDDLAYLEADKPIAFELDSATKASRAREVWSGPTPIRDGQGRIVDGSGIGIAVVDTGLDGLHPDYQAPGKVGGNWQVTPSGLVPAPYASTLNTGHGTHVAGIATGLGTASGELYKGVAPGSTLYSFNIFAGADGSIMFPAIAFDWILREGARLDPPIKVVNNSWRCLSTTCTNPLNPNQLYIQLTTALAKAGVVVTWAAGNEGGNGGVATINAASINPTPGVISVANYHDERTTLQTGVRDNRVSATSSRGDSADPTTWPDLAAPGGNVISTWAVTARAADGTVVSRNPVNGDNSYVLLTGTSMAAPHVAGVVALMRQVNPLLTPGEIEYVLKATSTKLPNPIGYVRADPAHPYDGSNYTEGHGLVDARAAVVLADGFTGIPAAPALEPIPASFVVSTPGVDVSRTLYLTPDLGMSPTYPESPPAPIHKNIREFLAFDGPVLEAPETFDAVHADLFIGTLHEYLATTHLALYFRFVVERVGVDGARTRLGETTKPTWYTLPLAPVHRRFPVILPQPVTLGAGERISVKVALERNTSDPAPASDLTLLAGGIAVYTGRPTASRIGIGTAIARPPAESDVSCRARQFCAAIGGDVEVSSVTCGATRTRLRWHGPAGSALVYSCDQTTMTCAIAGLPGDPDGDCEMEFDPVHPTAPASDGQCSYRIPGGARGGSGRCEARAYLEARN